MKERPIIFNTEMVRAILDGRKTQTRRVVKMQAPIDYSYPLNTEGAEWEWGTTYKDDDMAGWWPEYGKGINCPYGTIGDRLWVGETWWTEKYCDNKNPSELYGVETIWFADGELNGIPTHVKGKKRPSIFMPRWASRTTLEITDVRVERLQEISIEDVQAEGCTGSPFGKEADAMLFPTLWDSLNAKRGYSWESNPWVRIIEFKQCQ